MTPRRMATADNREFFVLTAWLMAITAQMTMRPALTYRAIELDAGVHGVAIVVAAFSSLAALLAISIGRYLDRYGCRRGFVMAGVLLAASSIGAAFGSTLWLLVASASLGGVAHVVAMLSAQAFAAQASTVEERQRKFARNAVQNSIGQIAGPMILAGTMAMARHQALESLVVLTFLAIVGMAAVCVIAARWVGGPPGTPVQNGRLRPTDLWRLARRPAMTGAVLAGAAITAAQDLVVAYLPLIGHEVGLSPTQVGVLLSSRGVASLTSRLSMMVLLRRLGFRLVLALALTAPAVAMLGMVWSRLFWQFMIAMILFGFWVGVATPLTTSWVAQLAPEGQRATALGMRMMGNRGGQVLVPLALGPASASLGLATVLVAPAAALFGLAAWASRADLGS